MKNLSFAGVWEALLDSLFPHSQEERLVLSLSPSQIIRRAPLLERLPDWQHAPLAYRNPLTHALINLLKYKNSQRAAEICAEIIWHELPYLLSDSLQGAHYLLVPIPTSHARLRERGYSQTERVAKYLVGLQGTSGSLVYSPLLMKSRETPAQTKTSSRNTRLKNLNNSFALKNGAEIRDTRIILLDDVITTGATLEEARKVLRRSGAKEVLAIAVAH